ncbi:HdeD family acid-resistance protein [Haladaptatus caseinilyticus]|uniref:HdeD family acid-resistance protein n=1 Tax=Haladaptatus caseinilyticus TaxID=2993314 RepID=UPI002E1A147D
MSTKVESGAEMVSNASETSWRASMGAGAIIAVIGVLAILSPFVAGVSLSILLGALLIVGALVHVAHAFSGGWKRFVIQALLAVVYAIAGIALLSNPVLGLTTLTILVVAFLFVEGILEIVMGFQARGDKGWGALVVSGVLALVIAGIIWAGFPGTALWAVGLLFGVNLLVTGVSMMFMAQGTRTAARKEAPSETEARGA